MTFDKNTKEITVNRGDRFTIKINNNLGTFKIGDKIKFSIVEKGDYNNVVLQKEFVINEESTEFYLTLTSEDTKIGDVISRPVTYWYEVEYNGDQTLIGYDKKEKAKKFILLPEAPNKGGNK